MRLGSSHPILGILGAMLLYWLALTGLLIAVGLLVTHVLGDGRLGNWDEHVGVWFVHRRTPLLNTVSADFTLLANTLGVVAVAGLVTALLLLRRWGRVAALVPIGLALELTGFLASNYVVARPRPGVKHLGSTPSTYSWPSGHAAATLVLYAGIALLVMAATTRLLPIVMAWFMATVAVIGVSLSRIYRGDHHPTDVIAGLVLGMGALGVAVLVVRAWRGATAVTGEELSSSGHQLAGGSRAAAG